MARYYDKADVMRRKALEPISQDDVGRIAAVKEAGQLLHDILENLEPSREMSLAKTKLEEAVMWAVKGLTA